MLENAMKYNIYIEKVMQKIENCLNEELSVEQLASIAKYSRSHFQELFRTYTGESVGNYVKRLRMEKSAFMLKYQYKKIIDVGIRTGFNNNTSFTRSFKSYYNISPLEFKQKFQNFEQKVECPDFTLITIDDFKVFYIREFGDYNQSSYCALEKANKGFEHIFDDKTTFITSCYGEPDITLSPNKMRFDACIIYVPEKHSHIKNLPLLKVKGGTFAKFKYQSESYDDFDKFYYQVYNTFFHKKDIQVSLKPAIQIVNNSFSDLLKDIVNIDLLIPLD